jgi:hypothetical protein
MQNTDKILNKSIIFQILRKEQRRTMSERVETLFLIFFPESKEMLIAELTIRVMRYCTSKR